tara:strand:- start:1505 stop:1702 length:198 start_codon:yes stop_codon:yes gene_type:complete
MEKITFFRIIKTFLIYIMPPKKHTKRVRFSKKNSTRRIPRRVIRKNTPFRKRRISLRRKKVTGGQ